MMLGPAPSSLDLGDAASILSIFFHLPAFSLPPSLPQSVLPKVTGGGGRTPAAEAEAGSPWPLREPGILAAALLLCHTALLLIAAGLGPSSECHHSGVTP